MKKLLLIALGLFIATTNANAMCSLKAQYPGSGPAPKAYCWDIIAVKSQDAGLEYTYQRGKYATDRNHGGSWTSGQFKNYMVAYVNVYGYGKTPDLKMNYRNAYLYATIPLTNVYRIITGYQYIFVVSNDSPDVKGYMEVKEYYNTKKRLYIR